MVLSNKLFLSTLLAVATVSAACGKKDEAPAPQPRPPMMPQTLPGFTPGANQFGNWQTGPLLRASPQPPQAFDNSIFTSGSLIQGSPLTNRAFMLANFDPSEMKPAIYVVSGNNTLSPVNDPRIFTYLFNDNSGRHITSPKYQSNETAEMVFEFDGSGNLKFIARVNQVIYEGLNIPYKFDLATGELRISKLMAVARNPVPQNMNQNNPSMGVAAIGLKAARGNDVIVAKIARDGTFNNNMGFSISSMVDVDFMASYQDMYRYQNQMMNQAVQGQPQSSTTTTTTVPGQQPRQQMTLANMPMMVSNPGLFHTVFTRFIGGEPVLRPIPQRL